MTCRPSRSPFAWCGSRWSRAPSSRPRRSPTRRRPTAWGGRGVFTPAGEGVICAEGGEGRWLYGRDGELLDSGTMEMVFPVGTWCYTSPNTVDGLRNDGTDQASVLGIELIPTTA